MANDFPPFVPHRLLRSGHAQTLAGGFLPRRRAVHRATTSRRASRRRPDRAARGLPEWLAEPRSFGRHVARAGRQSCQRVHAADRAQVGRPRRAGISHGPARLGAGVTLARLPYHSGRSADAADVLAALEPQMAVVAGDAGRVFAGRQYRAQAAGRVGRCPLRQLDSAVAVCPPVDLAAVSRDMSTVSNRPYDRYFVNALMEQVEQRGRDGTGGAGRQICASAAHAVGIRRSVYGCRVRIRRCRSLLSAVPVRRSGATHPLAGAAAGVARRSPDPQGTLERLRCLTTLNCA